MRGAERFPIGGELPTIFLENEAHFGRIERIFPDDDEIFFLRNALQVSPLRGI